MVEIISQEQKDILLHQLLETLAKRGLVKDWASLQRPHYALITECRNLIKVERNFRDFQTYLRSNPIIQQTVDTLLSHLAMAANVRWQDTPGVVHPLSYRGWHLNRWLPTFLIIDGPLGHFLSKSDSPLKLLLQKEYVAYPTLAQVRDAFNHDFFRLVRNGIGHWSFFWEENKGSSEIVIVDLKSNKPDMKVSLMEAEALHLVTYSVIEALDVEVFSKVNPNN